MVDPQGIAPNGPRAPRRAYPRSWGLIEAASGIAAALVLGGGWSWLTRTVVMPGELALAGAYLAVWVPLLAACTVAVVRGTRSPVRDLGLRFAWIDVLWGLGLGLVARAVTSLIELAAYGRTSGSGAFIQPGAFAVLFGLLFATVLAGPLIEELFFRGLLLRATLRTFPRVDAGPRPSAGAAPGGGAPADAAAPGGAHPAPLLRASIAAVAVPALVFALLHLADSAARSPASMAVTFASTLFLGLAAGTATVLTGRLGAAILAHAAYNGILVWLLLAT
ncbi:CPBP family intramembrane glutamic endopeptidase [Agromyces archimandritae]|uniref:CPBP family intramembrane metalloprotease n=1 Tax=Agromyces archimandritae TaxID=2781962 RepID=A0A975IPA4_9MICO|nr:CPBP family intramembrane glutamic endopeptidase [Agromyces archimandritae]QTX05438.1 CPBP family intramembrane metalloprotease [Agromyces archimandritae]